MTDTVGSVQSTVKDAHTELWEQRWRGREAILLHNTQGACSLQRGHVVAVPRMFLLSIRVILKSLCSPLTRIMHYLLLSRAIVSRLSLLQHLLPYNINVF